MAVALYLSSSSILDSSCHNGLACRSSLASYWDGSNRLRRELDGCLSLAGESELSEFMKYSVKHKSYS